VPELCSREDALSAGISRYFTGKPCKHGHLAERCVASGQCVICHRDMQRAYARKLRESRLRAREWGKTKLTREQIAAKAKAFSEANPDKIKEYTRKHYSQNKTKVIRRTRNTRYQKKINITLKQYESVMKSHNGKCDICKTENPGGPYNSFNLDHCHETGKLRGILCFRCNTTLGKFEDKIELFEAAIRYLRAPPNADIIHLVVTGELI